MLEDKEFNLLHLRKEQSEAEQYKINHKVRQKEKDQLQEQLKAIEHKGESKLLVLQSNHLKTVEAVGKKLDNQLLIEKREEKQKRAKDRIQIVKTKQKISKDHKKLEKKYKIAEQELGVSKKKQKELATVIATFQRENEEMNKEVEQLRKQNEEYFK